MSAASPSWGMRATPHAPPDVERQLEPHNEDALVNLVRPLAERVLAMVPVERLVLVGIVVWRVVLCIASRFQIAGGVVEAECHKSDEEGGDDGRGQRASWELGRRLYAPC